MTNQTLFGLGALNCWAMWRAALITKDKHVLRLKHTIDICNSEGDECRSVSLVFAEQGLIKAATYGLRSAPCAKLRNIYPFPVARCVKQRKSPSFFFLFSQTTRSPHVIPTSV